MWWDWLITGLFAAFFVVLLGFVVFQRRRDKALLESETPVGRAK
jgi:ABC-type branched-subunit amino acid transport system permease subunit